MNCLAILAATTAIGISGIEAQADQHDDALQASIYSRLHALNLSAGYPLFLKLTVTGTILIFVVDGSHYSSFSNADKRDVLSIAEVYGAGEWHKTAPIPPHGLTIVLEDEAGTKLASASRITFVPKPHDAGQ